MVQTKAAGGPSKGLYLGENRTPMLVATGDTVAVGEVVVVDPTVVDSSTSQFTTVRDVVAADQDRGIFGVVVDLMGSDGSAASTVLVQFSGQVLVDTTGDPAAGAYLEVTASNTLQAATAGHKIVGVVQAAVASASGDSTVFFDGINGIGSVT